MVHLGVCVDSCPDIDFYYNSFFNRCLPCDSNCSKCSSSKNCQECKPNKFIDEGMCVDSCPEGKKLNPESKKCSSSGSAGGSIGGSSNCTLP